LTAVGTMKRLSTLLALAAAVALVTAGVAVTNCNYWAYASDSYADPTLRPKLTIVYD
jgi:hypothetical protein